MRMVRELLPGGEGSAKRKGGRRPRPALLGAVGAGAAGMALAARRRKRSATNAPAQTEPQPEPRTVPPSAPEAEAPSSEDSD